MSESDEKASHSTDKIGEHLRASLISKTNHDVGAVMADIAYG